MSETVRKLAGANSKLPVGLFRSILVVFIISVISFLIGWPSNGYLRFLFLITTLVCAVGVDIWIRDVSSSHNFRSALDQYLVLNLLDVLGWIYYRKMQKDVTKMLQVQEEILLSFLSSNADTDYGRKFGFNKIKSRTDFTSRHPLTTYPDIEPYVDRMQNGEKEVFTKDQPKIFAVTSGTSSGKSSLLPFLRRQQTIFFLRGIVIMGHLMMTYFPETKNLRKGIKFFYSPRWRTSPAGIPIGPNSSSPGSSKTILHLYTTPPSVFKTMTEDDALYLQLLFALKDQDLGLMEANFASLIYNSFAFLEKRWSDIVRDIRDGTLLKTLNIPTDVRTELLDYLKPDANRAVELATEFEKGFTGVAKRIWPKLSLLLCVDSGAFEIYASVLRQKYCAGIPLYSPLYAATEGLIGLNIWPLFSPTKYLLVPRAMFYEFIALESIDEEQPPTLFVNEVAQNGIYELVLTNASGLCRYRFGDVVRIVEFFEQCPVVQFLYRKGQLLNVRGEKLSEKTFFEALKQSLESALLKGYLTDYITCESLVLEQILGKKNSYRPPYYGIFLELTSDCPSQNLDRIATKIDHHLQELSYVYKSFRRNNSIGLPEIYLVEPGSFIKFRQFLLQNSDTSSNQFKIPRVLKKAESVEYLLRECRRSF